MTKELYRYVFTPDAPIEEVEASLLLAILATESLHGESQSRLNRVREVPDLPDRGIVAGSGRGSGIL